MNMRERQGMIRLMIVHSEKIAIYIYNKSWLSDNLQMFNGYTTRRLPQFGIHCVKTFFSFDHTAPTTVSY